MVLVCIPYREVLFDLQVVVNQPSHGIVDLVRANVTCPADIDGDLSNGAIVVNGHILSGAFKDGVPPANPTSVLEHAAAHPQECSRPPLRRFKEREDRRYGSDVVKYPPLESCRSGMVGAEYVLLASFPCTF